MKTLKYAGRFLMRSKSYTIINLLGLAFSLACCIVWSKAGRTRIQPISRKIKS